VSGLANVLSISSSNGFNCVVLFNKTVSCWGNGATTPAAVSGLSNVSTVSVGPAHTCATLTDGTLRCWGTNSRGQLGDGTTTDAATPVTVGGLAGKTASAVGAAGTSTCAVFTDNTADCWGSGTLGELGNGAVVDSSTPVLVSLP
jgi:alpha-tubulin suppressor-like RCC1 family protein